jgi:type II secretory pathway pseudopilin PulG
MGQQQLILLVLATVIVGIAIVVGIAAFTENAAKANADAMMQDAVRIANDAQAAVRKPAPFGGVASLNDVTFASLGYPVTGGKYVNLNGEFELTCTDGECTIIGEGEDAQNSVTVIVCGPTQQNIIGAITKIGGQDAQGADFELECNDALPGAGAGGG